MEFLKKHYEKLILSVVLLGLAAVAATLPIKVKQEKEKEDQRKESLIGAQAKKLPEVDLSTNKMVLEKVKTPIKFDIAGKHNLFNPVTWQQRPDGSFLKVQTGREVGINALQVTAMNPLQLVVTFDDVVGNTNDLKYQVTVVRETDKAPRQSRALAKGGTSPIATLRDVVGPPDAPTGLVVQLPDRTEVTISKDKPFTKVIGYSADLYYDPTKWSKKGARKDDPIGLQGDRESYKIVAIQSNSVTFQANSNKKTTTLNLISK